MNKEISKAAVTTDINSACFRAGKRKGMWRVLSDNFPEMVIAVTATEPDGCMSEYAFHFELTDYPTAAPSVHPWDVGKNTFLPAEKRPRGNSKVEYSFKFWSNTGPVYRPWERESGAHNNWATTHPELTWSPNRNLCFIMEDIHDILNLNAISSPSRATA